MATEKLRKTMDTTGRLLPGGAKYVGVLCLAIVVGWVALNAVSAFGQSNPPNVDSAVPAPDGESRAAPAGANAAEKPLDIESLKQSLRDTKAIGVFSKLALRNQMDDLILQFRVHHARSQNNDIASLRPPYNMLVMKVLALVQDGDPALARTIAGSREALWRTLADPQKFKMIAKSAEPVSSAQPQPRTLSSLPGVPS